MKTLLLAGAMTVVLGLLASSSLAVAPKAMRVVHKPTATISFTSEVAIKGKYFKKREKLTISLSSTTINQKWSKKVTATPTGTFSLSFGHIALNSCNQYTLKVVGSLKSRYTTSHDFVPC